MFLHVFEWF
jgi:transposase